MSKYYIYRIVNQINNHDYIGRKKGFKTMDPLNDNYWGSGTLIKKAIQKYGKENFKKEILESDLSFEDAAKREVYWISEFKNKGAAYYNLSPGYEGLSYDGTVDEERLTEFLAYKSEKTKSSWENISEVDYEKRTFHMKEAWKNKNPTEKEAFSNKRSKIQREVYKNLSENERTGINEKRIASLKEMHRNRSVEYKEEINNKISQSLIQYNKSLDVAQKEEISKKHSDAQKNYLKKETEEHRKTRSINQSLAQGKYYKLIDPDGKEFVVKALAFWCRQTFGDKGPSANTAFRKRGCYKNYQFLGECENPDLI